MQSFRLENNLKCCCVVYVNCIMTTCDHSVAIITNSNSVFWCKIKLLVEYLNYSVLPINTA